MKRLSELPDGTTAETAAEVAYETWHDVTLREDQRLRPRCGNYDCVDPKHMEVVELDT